MSLRHAKTGIQAAHERALTADGRYGTAAMKVLSHCVSEISRRRELKADALILAGSMSRGEGIAMAEGGRVRFLSDMEFLVATSDDSRLRARRSRLAEAARAAAERARDEGSDCQVEFTFATRAYFRTVRPSIFRHDLSRHGRTVWGDPSILEAVAPCDPAEIPGEDAFFLLCNRLVEQIELGLGLAGGTEAGLGPFDLRYALLKGGTDLATSLLALVGAHEPLLSRRAEALAAIGPAALAGLPPEASAKMREAALARIDGSALSRYLHAPLDADAEWRSLARAQLHLARYELEQLRGAGRGDMLALVRWLSEAGDLRTAARERGKILLRASLAGRFGDAARLRLTGGLPRRMLYAWAIVLAARLAGVAEEFGLAGVEPSAFGPFPSKRGDDRGEGVRLVGLWKRYFRNF